MNIKEDNYQRKNYDVGIYCRLSNDDGELKESNSIANQRSILTKYVIHRGWNIYDIYIDDGYTGTNFNRPAFKRLIRDIEDNKISLVITKDMSRLGRDYIGVGHYIERYFPENNVRYIAINDNLDTEGSSNEKDITPFKAIINDMYSKDISRKIRSVFDDKRSNGKFIGSFAPYGYKKDPYDSSKLIIDPEAAPIVSRIFNMYIEGYGYTAIARKLNEERISPPSVYKMKKNKNYRNIKIKVSKWSHSSVRSILTNITYTGDLAQGKTKKVNYKSSKIKRLKRDQWIIVEKTHEAIISKGEFDMVQKEINRKKTNYGGAKRKRNLFSGFVFCGDCGHHMTYHKTPQNYYYLICSKYKKYGKEECTRHSIKEEKLKAMILDDFNKIINKHANIKELLKSANEAIKSKDSKEKIYKEEIKLIEKRLEEIKSISKTLYEDRVKAIVDKEQYLILYNEFNRERDNILGRKKQILKELNNRKKDSNKEAEELVDKILNLDKLNRPILIEIIDKIEIFQDQHIMIHYRMKNPEESILNGILLDLDGSPWF